MNSIIEVKNLNMAYGRSKVINNVSLNLSDKKVIGLCGPNGAGKTSLIKMLVGLIMSYEGEILIDGHKVSKVTKEIVSYQPDVINLDSSLTGHKAIKQYKALYSNFEEARFLELFAKLKLPLDKPLGKMSKGMKEKFQLALTLSRNAKVYIFDEPIAGVDPASRDSILETIINNYTNDALLLISTHIISDIESILDEVIFITDGEIILHENCDNLRDERNMSIDQIFREEFRW